MYFMLLKWRIVRSCSNISRSCRELAAKQSSLAVTPVLADRPNRYCRDKLCFAVATTWLQLCCLLLLFVLLSYLAALLMTILVKHAYGTKEPS